MKKKGLIISTVVMVVVLIASLTTATYAWFSQTAQAKIENISVSTEAAQGLQVAVKSGTQDTDYVHGDVDYQGGKWTGDPSFGSLVNFENITGSGKVLGSWKNAVTRVTTDSQSDIDEIGVYRKYDAATDDAKYFDGAQSKFKADASNKVYKVDKNTSALVSVTEEDGKDDVNYVKLEYKAKPSTEEANKTHYGDDMFLKPIGYTETTEPTGYVVAEANVDYLSLPISVQPTVDVGIIYCSITITPTQGTMAGWETYGPGMAAAAHVIVSNGTSTFEFVPYDSLKYGEMTTVNSATANKEFQLNFVIKAGSGDTKLKAGTKYDWNYIIWIEGTDDFCINGTTGSGFGVDIVYDYKEEIPSQAGTTESITANGKTDGSNATMKGIQSQHYFEVDGVKYYEFMTA